MFVRASLIVLACLAAVASAAEVTIKPITLTERRVRQIEKPKENFFSQPGGVEVELRIQGDAVKGATAWGKLKFTEAKDDTGADLTPKDSLNFGDSFSKLMEPFGQDKPKVRESFEVTLNLAQPARKAMKIASLKGEFQVLAGGTEKTVNVAKLKSMVGKALEHADLKAAGLEIKVAEIKKEGAMEVVALSVKGDLKAIKEGSIVDAAGKPLSMGHFTMTMNEVTTIGYHCEKAVDDAAALKLTLIIGQKTVTVPFALKDLDLP